MSTRTAPRLARPTSSATSCIRLQGDSPTNQLAVSQFPDWSAGGLVIFLKMLKLRLDNRFSQILSRRMESLAAWLTSSWFVGELSPHGVRRPILPHELARHVCVGNRARRTQFSGNVFADGPDRCRHALCGGCNFISFLSQLRAVRVRHRNQLHSGHSPRRWWVRWSWSSEWERITAWLWPLRSRRSPIVISFERPSPPQSSAAAASCV